MHMCTIPCITKTDDTYHKGGHPRRVDNFLGKMPACDSRDTLRGHFACETEN